MLRRCLLVAIVLVIACKKKSPSQGTGTGTGTGSAPGSAAPTQKFTAEWNVISANGVCSANEHGSCPPDTECTPPPPRAIECPAGAAEGVVRVGQLEDATCVVAGTSTKTPCPLPKGEALAPTSYAVTALPDGTCRASWTSPAAGTKAITIKCPVPDANVTMSRAKTGDKCVVEHGGKTIETPCPVEPKLLTAAALRDAFTKDAASFANQRVRVQGFFVKSLMSQQAGKQTTFTIGAADTKADIKTAIKCQSIVELPELPDGDPVIVEGVAKKATGDVVLVECQATVP